MRRVALSLQLRHCVVGALVIAGCSVYELPSDALEPDDTGGSAGTSSDATSGTSGKSSGGGASGGQPSTAGTSTTAGNGGGAAVGGGGAPVEPPPGGEGGAAPEPDLCPEDPDKLAPGACGCGLPDDDTEALADCRGIAAALVHRYDFEGTGAAVMDRAGTAHGTIVGDAVLANGVVELGGGTAGPYVDLPNGIVSALRDASFESWVTWRGGNAWQRLFDFGDSTHSTPENNPANGKTYLYMTAKSSEGLALAGYSLGGNSMGEELRIVTSGPLMQSVMSHVVLVANDTMNRMTLYINGEAVAQESWSGKLSSINDVNVWLGRSQYSGDHELNGVYHDFRIYDAALSATQVATCFAAGPDPAFLAD